tara:strand:+ start:761 stop:1750 length:990 start_codon:yes stop_codon:yes gene_type:complete
MKTPSFWYKTKPGILSGILSPLSALYRFGATKKARSYKSYKSKVPVICVGNVTAGGGGKTPVVKALYKLLQEHSLSLEPVILTRGYGGSIAGPERVNKFGPADIWGDEALLHAQYASVTKSENRAKGARFIERENGTLILMDDGAQNRQLKKDILFYVIKGNRGFGNKCLIPSGPLREPLEIAFEKADAFILIGEDETGVQKHLPTEKPLFNAELKLPSNIPSKDKTYIGFAGLAFPEGFKITLEENGYRIKEFIEFSDHHNYTERDIENLFNRAYDQQATLITTEKDYMRLPPFAKKDEISVLSIDMEFKEPEKILSFLKDKLNNLNN